MGLNPAADGKALSKGLVFSLFERLSKLLFLGKILSYKSKSRCDCLCKELTPLVDDNALSVLLTLRRSDCLCKELAPLVDDNALSVLLTLRRSYRILIRKMSNITCKTH